MTPNWDPSLEHSQLGLFWKFQENLWKLEMLEYVGMKSSSVPLNPIHTVIIRNIPPSCGQSQNADVLNVSSRCGKPWEAIRTSLVLSSFKQPSRISFLYTVLTPGKEGESISCQGVQRTRAGTIKLLDASNVYIANSKVPNFNR